MEDLTEEEVLQVPDPEFESMVDDIAESVDTDLVRFEFPGAKQSYAESKRGFGGNTTPRRAPRR